MYNSAEDVIPIDPSGADVILTEDIYALRANGAGVIVLLTRSGNVRTMNFLAGETRQVVAGVIYKTGTTCTGIEGSVSGFALAPNIIPGDASTIPGDVTQQTPDATQTSDGSDVPNTDGTDTTPATG